MVEVGPRSMPTKVTRDSHNVQKVTDRAHPRGTSPEQQSSGAPLPVVCSNPTCLHTDQNHSEETDLGALFHQPGLRPTTDRAVTATE